MFTFAKEKEHQGLLNHLPKPSAASVAMRWQASD